MGESYSMWVVSNMSLPKYKLLLIFPVFRVNINKNNSLNFSTESTGGGRKWLEKDLQNAFYC